MDGCGHGFGAEQSCGECGLEARERAWRVDLALFEWRRESGQPCVDAEPGHGEAVEGSAAAITVGQMTFDELAIMKRGGLFERAWSRRVFRQSISTFSQKSRRNFFSNRALARVIKTCGANRARAEQCRDFLRGVTARAENNDLGLDGLELRDDDADTVAPLFGEQNVEGDIHGVRYSQPAGLASRKPAPRCE